MRVFNGNYHQGQIVSDLAGFQCTAIAFYALLVISTIPNPQTDTSTFQPEFIDNIVGYGHQMYQQLLYQSQTPNPRYLGHWELPRLVQYNNEYIEVHRYENVLYGYVGTDVQFPYGTSTIEDALPRAFSISNSFVATFGSNTIAIFRTTGTSHWYLFDSHSRNNSGMQHAFGSASIIEFIDLEECVHFNQHNYNGLPFEITPVMFENHNDVLTCSPTNENNINEMDMTDMEVNERPDISINENTCNTNFSNVMDVNSIQTEVNEMSETENPFSTMKENEKNMKKNIFIHIDLLSGDIKKYEQNIRMVVSSHCCCCQRILFEDQVRKLPKTFDMTMPNGIRLNECSTVCPRCASKLTQKKTPVKYIDNNLDVGPVPKCLLDLDIIQKRLVSQIQSYMTIIILPGGQYAERGLAIHFPVDLESYFKTLQNNQNQSIIVVTHAKGKPQVKSMHCHEVVNFDSVRNAIIWLKANNLLYYNFPDLCNNTSTVVEENSSVEVLKSNVGQFIETCEQSASVPINYSIPDIEIDKILNTNNRFEIPIQFDKPTWLSQIPHGEEMAFPWLFPFGSSGLYDDRPNKLTVLEYYHHRLYNKDPRWRKNITYLMYAVNHMEQSKLSNEIEIQMRLRKSEGKMTASTLQDSSQLPKIKENSFMFMKKIRGTVAYWADILHNLLATVKSLGPPTLFVTLSADDCNWPELKMLLNDISYQEALKDEQLNENMRKDPLLTSLHFERRWKNFFKFVLMGKEKPLGNIEDYFARIEYQNRGSPHLHMFLWITNAPSLISSQSSEIVQYIDKVISTRLPSKENDPELYFLVKRLQIHQHTQSCRRNNVCRFGFPKIPSTQTRILNNVNITNQSSRGHFYQTIRTEHDINVNAYNPYLLRRWRANMDIQMVSGVHGLAYYVCSYIAKAEPDDLKNALGKTFENISSNIDQISIKKQMYLIGNCILKTRRLSAQEAAARVGNLQLVWSSRSTVFLNTRPIDERYRVLLPKDHRNKLASNSTEIFTTNILDYYIDRPNDMNEISLFKFASWFKLSTSESTDVSSRSCQRIKLMSSNKIMQKRKRPAIIRTPKFQGNSEQYYFSLLMLHFPYRNESNIILPYLSAKQAFLGKHHLFNTSDIQYEAYLHDIEKTVRLLHTTREDIGVVVAPNTYEPEETSDQISEEYAFVSTEAIEKNTTNPSETLFCRNNDQQMIENIHSLQVNLLSPEELDSDIDRLTNDQRNVFLLVKKHFDMSCKKPLHLFISGGAGTGKSFLIKTMVEWLRLFTASFAGSDPVLVCGPTGMSAKNIRGKTLHSTFKLPVQHGSEPTYKELSCKTLQDLRQSYRAVHTILIDEISMVSSQTLLYIHRRLSAIKGNDDYFGGINVILIGDFHQLKPVRGSFSFQNTVLWNLFDTYILNTNMRQTSLDGYSEILNRIRVGTYILKDIETLSSRLISSDDHCFDGALRVYPTLKEVMVYNQQQQKNILDNTFEILARHQFSSSIVEGNDDILDFVPTDDRAAGGLPNSLVLSIGTRVMLIRNIATEQGLINGALGFVRHIELHENIPVQVYVQFDNSTVGRLFYNEHYDATLIEQISQEFYYKGRSVTRTQFPLLPAWASTIHKVQGITCDKIVLGLGKSVFAEGQVYVALSRVRTLDGLAIESFDPSKIKANELVLKFYRSLSEVKKHTHD